MIDFKGVVFLFLFSIAGVLVFTTALSFLTNTCYAWEKCSWPSRCYSQTGCGYGCVCVKTEESRYRGKCMPAYRY